MSIVALRLLRRIALGALLLAAMLLVGPRLLARFGVVGPDAQALVSTASSALETARSYGALPDEPAFREATAALLAARGHLQRGEAREARELAREASGQAVVAQRRALSRRAEQRQRASEIAENVDQRLITLESLYNETASGLPDAAKKPLVTEMKKARQAGAALLLAFEENRLEDVIAQEQPAHAAIETARQRVGEARKR